MGLKENPKKNDIPNITQASLSSLRADFRAAISALISAMLQSANWQFSGAICHVSGTTLRPKTLAELASMAGISYSQAKRAMAFLYEKNWVFSYQHKMRGKAKNTIAVSAGLRFFTPLFWKTIGRFYSWQKAMKFAKERKKYRFTVPMKQIALRPGSTASSVKSLINKWKNSAKQARNSAKSALRQAQFYLFGPPAGRPAPTPAAPVQVATPPPPPDFGGSGQGVVKRNCEVIRAMLSRARE